MYLFHLLIVKTLLKTRATGTVEPLKELPQVAESTGDLCDLLTTVLAYVEDVVNDKILPDNSIGRNLLKLVQAVPKMSRDELDTMLNSNIKVRKSSSLLFNIHAIISANFIYVYYTKL